MCRLVTVGDVRFFKLLLEETMKFGFATLAMLVIGAGSAWAQSFPQCPAVEDDTSGCEFLITVTAVDGSGAATNFTVATSSPDLGPYDGCDDTLVGILNNSGATLKSVTLSGSVAGDGIFDFDGDGACAAITCTNGAGDTSGYGGPGVNFSAIGGTLDSTGTVNVGCTGVGTCAGIAAAGTAWFSLEGTLTASVLGPPPSTTPIPNSVLLMFLGLAIVATFYFANGKFARAS
jgi:hypothetical protein